MEMVPRGSVCGPLVAWSRGVVPIRGLRGPGLWFSVAVLDGAC